MDLRAKVAKASVEKEGVQAAVECIISLLGLKVKEEKEGLQEQRRGPFGFSRMSFCISQLHFTLFVFSSTKYRVKNKQLLM